MLGMTQGMGSSHSTVDQYAMSITSLWQFFHLDEIGKCVVQPLNMALNNSVQVALAAVTGLLSSRHATALCHGGWRPVVGGKLCGERSCIGAAKSPSGTTLSSERTMCERTGIGLVYGLFTRAGQNALETL
jgi:hypothetical protein